MKKPLGITLGIICFIGFVITFLQGSLQLPNLARIADYTYWEEEQEYYIGENRGKDMLLYRVNNHGEIISLLKREKAGDYYYDGLAGICFEEFAYLLERTAASDNANRFLVKKYDKDFVEQEFVMEFECDKEFQFVSMEMNRGMIALRFLSGDGTMENTYGLDTETTGDSFQLKASVPYTGGGTKESIPLNGLQYTSSVGMKVVQNLIVRNALICMSVIGYFLVWYFIFRSKKSFMLRRFFTLESLLIGIILIGASCNLSVMVYKEWQEEKKLFIACGEVLQRNMGSIKKDENSRIKEKILHSRQLLEKLIGIEEIAIVTLQKGKPLLTVSIYGQERKAIESGDKKAFRIVSNKTGKKVGIYMIPEEGMGNTGNYIAMVIRLDSFLQHLREYFGISMVISMVLLATGTVIVLFATYGFGREVAVLSKEMEGVARGKLKFRRLPCKSVEMERMWGAFEELVNQGKKVNYENYLMYQAYSRFSPRKLEEMLYKASIIDVHIGDKVEVNGTVGLLELKQTEEKNVEQLEKLVGNFSIASKHQVWWEGISLSHDANLSNSKMFFLENPEYAVKFGINTIQEISEKNNYCENDVTILLHRTKLQYGVTGIEEQAVPYAISQEIDYLNEYMERLREVKIPMVITETVETELNEKLGRRYIGYVELGDTGHNIKLYEILDIYAEKERKG